MINIILGIIEQGLTIIGEERRTRFMSEYHEILTKLSHVENSQNDEYSDGERDSLEEDLENMLKAFGGELKNYNSK